MSGNWAERIEEGFAPKSHSRREYKNVVGIKMAMRLACRTVLCVGLTVYVLTSGRDAVRSANAVGDSGGWDQRGSASRGPEGRSRMLHPGTDQVTNHTMCPDVFNCPGRYWKMQPDGETLVQLNTTT